MTVYIDTNVAVWLSQGAPERLTLRARAALEETPLLLSPMVLLELEYLYEIKRILIPAVEIELKLRYELDVEVCKHDFPSIIKSALHENWTRDPFDRIIVAHAKANGFASLISADEDIQKNYQRTIW